MLATVMHMLPAWCVFENVGGLRRYLKQFYRKCDQQGISKHYAMFIVPLCPAVTLKEPCRRQRLYVCLVRKDLIFSDDVFLQARLVETLVKSVSASAKTLHLSNVLGHRKSTKISLTAREKTVLQDALHRHGCTTQCPLVVDVSQSLGRAPVGKGVAPCLTTSSRLVVARSAFDLQFVDARDKLMLHGVPLGRYSIPKTLPEAKLHVLCGNSMHIGCVGLAMLICFSLIDWQKESCRHGYRPQTVSSGSSPFKPVVWGSVKALVGGKSSFKERVARGKRKRRPRSQHSQSKKQKPKRCRKLISRTPVFASAPGKDQPPAKKSRFANLLGK
eukprot:Skav223731  [mRNA]  locus=scaffold424:24116:25105:- [translate_table: standard]